MYTVNVSADDRAKGEAGNCFRCAVALAIQRATGDGHANVYEREWAMYLEVHGRHIVAPQRVRQFLYAFDALDREDKRGRLPRVLPDELKCFTFTLPSLGDPEWKEQCCECESLVSASELDDEGACRECTPVESLT